MIIQQPLCTVFLSFIAECFLWFNYLFLSWLVLFYYAVMQKDFIVLSQ